MNCVKSQNVLDVNYFKQKKWSICSTFSLLPRDDWQRRGAARTTPCGAPSAYTVKLVCSFYTNVYGKCLLWHIYGGSSVNKVTKYFFFKLQSMWAHTLHISVLSWVSWQNIRLRYYCVIEVWITSSSSSSSHCIDVLQVQPGYTVYANNPK